MASLRFQNSKISDRLHRSKKHDNQKEVSMRWKTSEDKSNPVGKNDFSPESMKKTENPKMIKL